MGRQHAIFQCRCGPPARPCETTSRTEPFMWKLAMAPRGGPWKRSTPLTTSRTPPGVSSRSHFVVAQSLKIRLGREAILHLLLETCFRVSVNVQLPLEHFSFLIRFVVKIRFRAEQPCTDLDQVGYWRQARVAAVGPVKAGKVRRTMVRKGIAGGVPSRSSAIAQRVTAALLDPSMPSAASRVRRECIRDPSTVPSRAAAFP